MSGKRIDPEEWAAFEVLVGDLEEVVGRLDAAMRGLEAAEDRQEGEAPAYELLVRMGAAGERLDDVWTTISAIETDALMGVLFGDALGTAHGDPAHADFITGEYLADVRRFDEARNAR